MSDKILQALRQLDANNPNHWTADGAPRLDTLKLLTGDSAITREQVTAAAPGFNRAFQAPAYPPQQPAAAVQAAGQGGSASSEPETAPAAVQGASQGSNDGTVQKDGAGVDANTQTETGASSPQDALAAARRVYAAAMAEKAKTDRAVAEASAAMDRAIEASEKSGGTETHAQTVVAYLATQQAIRDERAVKAQAMKGVNLKDLLPTKAMLDEAFKRRTGRGLKRPSSL